MVSHISDICGDINFFFNIFTAAENIISQSVDSASDDKFSVETSAVFKCTEIDFRYIIRDNNISGKIFTISESAVANLGNPGSDGKISSKTVAILESGASDSYN